MGTESLVYINGELLCYTRYDGQPFNLGEDLRRVRTDWKEILRICKAHSILAVSLKFWLKNPEFVYNCYPIDRKDTCKKILKPEVQKELEDNVKAVYDMVLEEVVFMPVNELYDKAFHTEEDYQYNHRKNEVFVRLGYKNFPWVAFEDMDSFNCDENLDNILLDMAGVIEFSDISSELYLKLQEDGPVSSGRHFILACKKATQYLPNDPNSWWNYGVSLELARKYEQAINVYEKAKELTPMNPIIHRILGETYLKINQNSEALNSFKNSINYLADIKEMKNLDKEIIIIENLITESIEFEALLNLLYKNLIDIYKNFEISTSSNKVGIWKKIGWAYYKIGKIDESINAFENVLDFIFESNLVHIIEEGLNALKKFFDEIAFREINTINEKIIEMLKKKTEEYPKEISIWRLLAKTLYDLNEEQEAHEAFKNCIIILGGFYNKKNLEKEKKTLIDIIKNTQFKVLISSIEEITPKKKEELVRTLPGPKQIGNVKFSPDGKLIVASGREKEIKIFNVETGDIFKTLDTTPFNWVSFSPDGKYLAVSYQKIQIWDINKGLMEFLLVDHKPGHIYTAFTPNGKFLVSACEHDGTIKLWEFSKEKVIWTHVVKILKNYTSLGDFNFEISPDGKIIVYTHENRITLIDINNGNIIKQYDGRWPITISPNGRYIATPHDKTTLNIVDFNTGEVIKSLSGHKFELKSLIITPNNEFIIGGEEYNYRSKKGCNIYIWKYSTGELIKILEGHTNDVCSLDVTPDGRYIASGDWDETINIWKFGK